MKNEKKSLDEERQALLKARAKLELDLADLQAIISRSNATQTSAQEKLATLDAQIAQKQNQLAENILPQFQEVTSKKVIYFSNYSRR